MANPDTAKRIKRAYKTKTILCLYFAMNKFCNIFIGNLLNEPFSDILKGFLSGAPLSHTTSLETFHCDKSMHVLLYPHG